MCSRRWPGNPSPPPASPSITARAHCSASQPVQAAEADSGEVGERSARPFSPPPPPMRKLSRGDCGQDLRRGCLGMEHRKASKAGRGGQRRAWIEPRLKPPALLFRVQEPLCSSPTSRFGLGSHGTGVLVRAGPRPAGDARPRPGPPSRCLLRTVICRSNAPGKYHHTLRKRFLQSVACAFAHRISSTPSPSRGGGPSTPPPVT